MGNYQENQEKEVLTPEVEIVQTSIIPVKQQQSGVAMLFTPERKEKLIQAFIQTEVSNYTTSPVVNCFHFSVSLGYKTTE